MLCQFSFRNYKAFKEEATLDMMAESISEHRDTLLVDEQDNEKFLPVLAIYGPNGGGKSTVLEALDFLRLCVLQKIVLMKLEDEKEKYSSVINKFSLHVSEARYHRFDPRCKDIPTGFEVMFRVEGMQYKYEISLQKNIITEENLYAQKIGEKYVKAVFERSGDECYLGEDVEDIVVEKVSEKMPLISHIAINYDIEIIDRAVRWFMDIEVMNYDDFRKERKILIPKEEKEQKRLFKMLRDMDIPISDVRLERDLDGNITNIFTKHILQDGANYEVPFEEESSGTKKLFSFLGDCLFCLEKGNLMIADELDAKLHPKLLQYILELFMNRRTNGSGAQLLLTSHDMVTMVREVFRRDEIWFCARNPMGASKLYSLISFRKESGAVPRNDEAYGKQYIEGNYGADPYIKRILKWGEEDELKAEEGE